MKIMNYYNSNVKASWKTIKTHNNKTIFKDHISKEEFIMKMTE